MPYAYMLEPREGQELLRIARATLREFLESGRIPPGAPHRESLRANAGAFVTLRKEEALRGCVGTLEERAPLFRTVQEMTIGAATRDARFARVGLDEVEGLSFEISVLCGRHTVERHDVLETLRVGRHGVHVIGPGGNGVLLPAVAVEHGWDAAELLRQTCRKAGLADDAWQSEQAVIELFESQVFSEPTQQRSLAG